MHIAMIGCGQLARMMAFEGWHLGLTFSFLADPGENRSCVEGLGNIVELTPELTGRKLFEALGEPAVVTVEREHVDVKMLKDLASFCEVNPNPDAIEICQHRGREKNFVNALGVPTAPYRLINSAASLKAAIEAMGLPVIVKSCEEGYDGRGQWKIDNTQELDALLLENTMEGDFIVEGFVAFEKEASIVAMRSSKGECAFYPLAENEHRNGILISSIAPAELPSPSLSAEARKIAQTIIEEMEYVGVLSIEFFVMNDKLLVNELAPRVHNSGHWTQAAGICSQFENHLRSIAGIMLGATEPTTHVGMVNVLGQKLNTNWLVDSNVQLNDYNKTPRPNRKVGHLNVWNTDRQKLIDQISELKCAIYGDE
ncbi:MAG: 5-(carboxyamino)imidazole ribonucleotide synthase [Oceanospirillales bacterium LUC14_002_19_P2]|nr:MAG: 5-(carboxyamino)imidazole ribonucleotide synthase [Oceanospirillales bacterium LUC14_002_19_P2]